MKMIVIRALLLFLLYDSTFAQESQECIAAQAALTSAEPECQQAYQQVANATNMINSTNSTDSTNGTIISTLEEYCSSSCRPIVENIASACVSGPVV